jgi:hypothetical protein
MTEITIRDEARQQELKFKLNDEGDAVGYEVYFDHPRPMSSFINYSAFQIPPTLGKPPGAGAIPPSMPRPCGGN